MAALAGVVCAAALLGTPAEAATRPAAQATAATNAADRTIRLGGVRVNLRANTRQVVTVNHRVGWHANVRMWTKDGDRWRRTFTARDGRTGYGGLVRGPDREQGTGTTPIGSYSMTESFGIARQPRGTDLRFHRVRPGDYWVQDNASRWYNTLRNRHKGGFRWRLDGYNSSERLKDYPGQYRWSVVVDFNRPTPVRHRGSGIFLHVNGRGATAGCVSTPKWFMRKAMKRLDPGKHPLIAIGR
ncbi:MAG: hypothetical protein H0W95_09120 [Nocardioidaceae bacterium]|nr:hypothetical protein [Nocardioidaceae bacterium]